MPSTSQTSRFSPGQSGWCCSRRPRKTPRDLGLRMRYIWRRHPRRLAMILPRSSVLIVTLCLLAACGNRGEDVTLSRITSTGAGPDEFSVLPSKPLQTPEDFAALPTPTPGAGNLTDQNPKADGVAALGGNPAALNTGAASQRDAGLVRHTSRYG